MKINQLKRRSELVRKLTGTSKLTAKGDEWNRFNLQSQRRQLYTIRKSWRVLEPQRKLTGMVGNSSSRQPEVAKWSRKLEISRNYDSVEITEENPALSTMASSIKVAKWLRQGLTTGNGNIDV